MIKNYRFGVTLPEVLVGFLIVVVAIFGAMGALEYGHKATRSDFRHGEAIQILADRMNKISALSYSTLKSYVESAGGSADIESEQFGVPFGEISVGANKYYAKVNITYFPMRFSGLSQLQFPNKDYDPKKPETWLMEEREDDVFDETGKGYNAVKVIVSVKPIGYKMVKGDKPREEGEVVAMTIITDLEG